MKISAALLCAVSAAAFAGTTPASDARPAEQTTASAQDTLSQRTPSDTTARKTPLPKRRTPKHPPRYCPACGMG